MGTTIAQAIERSGVLRQFPEIDLAHNKVGVFGKLADLNTPLRAGDRVEIYRVLIAAAKALRRQRAERRPANNVGAAREARASLVCPSAGAVPAGRSTPSRSRRVSMSFSM